MQLRDDKQHPSATPPRSIGRGLDGEAMRRRIAARLFDEPSEPVRVGRFRIIGTLGEGGMGVVLAAEDEDLDRRIAIKILRDERLRSDTAEHARLAREARTLAKLSHPNVVQVYEVGEHNGGIFIAMELVRGTNLRQWLSARTRSLDEILEQFLAAAHGLDAAHRVGVVHRDFKPSNALVGEDGRVRIADFGLARGLWPASSTGQGSATSDSAGSSTRVAAVGTPAYMSPEQQSGLNVDERSDQYSFCVALHEAVHGQRPGPAGSSRANQPAKSAKLPRWLRQLLARGLSPRPEDRYPSMAALIEALQAGPRRRRSRIQAAGLTAALAAAVAIGSALSSEPPRDLCPDPRPQLAGYWDTGQRQALRTTFTATALPYAASTLTRVEGALDAYAERWARARNDACEATWIRGERSQDLLDQSERCLDSARTSFTNLIRVLAAADAALVADADALVTSLPSPEHCRDPHALTMLPPRREQRPDERLAAELERARIYYATRQGRRAADLLEPALALLQKAGDTAGEAEALLLLGKIQGRLLREPASATDSLHQAYDRATAGDRRDLIWDIWNEQAWIQTSELAAAGESRRMLAHARSALRRLGTSDPLPEAAIQSVESAVLLAEHRAEEAVRLRSAIVETLRANLVADHPDLQSARDSLAAALSASGALDRSRALHHEVMLELSGRYGSEHPLAARSELNLGLDCLDLGDLADARKHLTHAREVFVTTYGPHSPVVGNCEFGLAMVEAAEGAYDRSVARAEVALEIFNDTLPRSHRDRVGVLILLIGYYEKQGQTEKIVDVTRELLTIHDDGYTGELDLDGVLINLGEALCALDRCGEALDHYHRLASLYQLEPPEEPAFLAFPQRGLGLAYLAVGQPALARPYLERAYALMRDSPRDRDGLDANFIATARALGEALKALGEQPARARALRKFADAAASGRSLPPP